MRQLEYDPVKNISNWKTVKSEAKRYIFVSDIHGNMDALRHLSELPDYNDPDTAIVFGGDYVDGYGNNQSLEVLTYVMDLVKKGKAFAIRGNHEQMFLDYLDFPDMNKDLYFMNGGKATVKAFLGRGYSASVSATKIKSDYMNLIAFLYKLPYMLVLSPDIAVVHAGLDREHYAEVKRGTIDRYNIFDLLWTRETYYTNSADLPFTLVSGHTPTVSMLMDIFEYDQNFGALDQNNGVALKDMLTLYGSNEAPIVEQHYGSTRYYIDAGSHAKKMTTDTVLKDINVLQLSSDGKREHTYTLNPNGWEETAVKKN